LISARYIASEPALEGTVDGCMRFLPALRGRCATVEA
jgi:hypothetical protein